MNALKHTMAQNVVITLSCDWTWPHSVKLDISIYFAVYKEKAIYKDDRIILIRVCYGYFNSFGEDIYKPLIFLSLK